ncbi:hypothetical protein ES707_06188 [subsurface metagenome]
MADEEKKEPNPLEEKLNRLKAKATELEALVAHKDKELASRDSRISKLEQVIADKESQITNLKQSLAESDEQGKRLSDSLAQAIASYKALVIEATPQVPPELITGDTIEAINESLTKAKSLVSKVRQGLEAEIISAKVPSGAPVRTLPDFSTLSSREKIQYAIGGSSS